MIESGNLAFHRMHFLQNLNFQGSVSILDFWAGAAPSQNKITVRCSRIMVDYRKIRGMKIYSNFMMKHLITFATLAMPRKKGTKQLSQSICRTFHDVLYLGLPNINIAQY